MDFAQLAEERYSLRQFDRKLVEWKKLEQVLRAGRLAPTAANHQPQRILVIESPAALERLKSCTRYHFDAPLALLVCFDNAESWVRPFDQERSGTVDAAIVTTHMMLQAADLGLGTTWVGHFDPAKVREAFRLPERFVPVAILPMGYPAAGATKHAMHFQRRPLEEIVAYNDFSTMA